MLQESPLVIFHEFYESTSSAKPKSENKTFKTIIPNVYHTFHGRGDSVSTNGSAAQYQIKKGPFLRTLGNLSASFFGPVIFGSVLLSTEVNSVLDLACTICKTLSEHPDTCPTWMTNARMTSQLALRPWLAYRIDVAIHLIKTGQREDYEKDYRDAYLKLINREPLPPHLREIRSGPKMSCAHVLHGIFGTRLVVALSYSRNPFRKENLSPYRDNLSNWIEQTWKKTKWESVCSGIMQNITNFFSAGSNSSQTIPGNFPLIWIDAFGMDGVSKFEQNEWAKFSLFTYSLLPVLAHVPTIIDWKYIAEDEEKAAEAGNAYKYDPNELIFYRLDFEMWHFSKHVSSCQHCLLQLRAVRQRVLNSWGDVKEFTHLKDTSDDLIEFEIVRLLHHFRVWPVIERSMGLYVHRLLVEAHAWKAIFRTYCLGLMAVDWVTSHDRTPFCEEYVNKAIQLIENFGLTYFRGLLHHLGDEAKFAIPTTQNEHVPKRKVKLIQLMDFVLHKDHLQMMERAYPVLSGQIPTVQIRGASYEKNKQKVERFDRRFIMLLSEFEPNHLDAAYLQTGKASGRHDPEIAKLVEERIGGRPENFYPTEYMRNWLDDSQMTNFAWGMSRHMWYVSRMALRMPPCDAGHSYVTSRVSPVLTKSIFDMVPEAKNVKEFESRRLAVCPVVGLDKSKLGDRLGDSKESHIIELGGKYYAAFAMRSYSYQYRCDKSECLKLSYTCSCKDERLEYCHDIALCEDTGKYDGNRKKVMTALFTITLCGRKLQTESGTEVQWVVAGDDKETGSLQVVSNIKAVPLFVNGGNLLSLQFMGVTRSESATNGREHVPYKLFTTRRSWGSEWNHVGLKINQPDVTSCEFAAVIQ